MCSKGKSLNNVLATAIGSCAMESDIVAEGFRLTHGIRVLKLVGDGDSSVLATIRQRGSYVENIECANHACSEVLAKENPQYRGKGGLTKRAVQRLTVGALIAIRMHSKGVNVQQLRHVVLLMSLVTVNPVIPSFVNIVQPAQLESARASEGDETPHDDHSSTAHRNQPTSMVDQISRIVSTEMENEPTPEMEATARGGYSAPLSSLPDGLFCKVMACGDRLVMLAPQLISNLTSNLAECYMGLRTICDGGKQYNRIQSGSFQHGCYTVGLQAQHGPPWKVKFWEETMREPASQVYM